MLSEGLLFRSVTPPKGCKDRVLDPSSFVQLSKIDEQLEAYELSIGSFTRLLDEPSRHSYGRRVAEIMRKREFERRGFSPPPGDEVRYAGYYEFSYGAVRKICWPLHTVSVYWSPDGELTDHFALRVAWNGAASPRKARTLERLNIVSELCSYLVGPTRYTSTHDTDPDGDAGTFELPSLPNGV